MGDPLLIAEVTLQSGNPLWATLLQCLKRTEDRKAKRASPALFGLPDAEFQRDNNERDLLKMRNFQLFEKIQGGVFILSGFVSSRRSSI